MSPNPPLPATGYEPLPASDLSFTKELKTPPTVRSYEALRRQTSILGVILSFSVALNVLFAVSLSLGDFVSTFQPSRVTNWTRWRGAQPVYSPAAGAIAHELKLWPTFTHVDEYHGNRTMEQDRLWSKLYVPFSWVAVSRELTAPLLNHTERIPGDVERIGEPRYAMDLDVFHQLHCLDMLRKKIKPAPWDKHQPPAFPPVRAPGDPTYDHIDHCLNSIRRTLMCNPDITPVVWQWNSEIQQNRPRIDVLHTCVNWDSLTDWAKERKLHFPLDMLTHEEDDWQRVLPTQ